MRGSRGGSDGRQALDYLTTITDGEYPRPDIVLLDINMPVMNGWEFLDAYCKLPTDQHERLIVVVLTSSGNPSARMTTENVSVTFQSKPVKRDVLVKILAEHFPHFADEFRTADSSL